jgi:hypothetical protein
MRYRRLDSGDMTFGRGASDFLVNSPETVAQAVRTRLGLQLGDWFLNNQEGIDWRARVLGKYTIDTRDLTIRDRILGTLGVTGISNYVSLLNVDNRAFTVSVTIDTIYGKVQIEETV